MAQLIKGIAHTALTVGDMERSIDFYTNALGFKKAFEIHDDADRPWIVYMHVGGDQFIELFYPKPDDQRMTGQIGANHVCFAVDDIEVVAEHFRQGGYPLDVAPQTGKDHNRQCWTHDPDGNRIELMQLSPESPQCIFAAKAE